MLVGEVVAGRYELEELVGSGGMSSVYRAHDRVLDRRVAIKLLHERYARDEDYLERFRREARAAAQLSHPNIVTVIDRGETEGRPFIVFEYVDGETLKGVVESAAPMPVRDAIELALQIAGALAFAHARGVVHRDVKPQNVLLDGDGRAKVTDFGIARSLDLDAGVTQTGTVLGTSDYMAPEQAMGERASARSDVYSLGAVLFELLTGEVLFPGETFMSVALKHASEPPPSVLELRPDCPVRVAAAVDRCLAKDPEERFASMGELVGELEACLLDLETRGEEDATLIVAPPRRPHPAVREPRRRSWVPALVLGLGLPALAVIVAVLVVERDSIRNVLPFVSKPVTVKAVGTYDPLPGDGAENDYLVRRATDGNTHTAWSTEFYASWFKKGVGLVLRTPKSEQLTEMTVKTDRRGFVARIKAGPSSAGPWTSVSPLETVRRQETFDLDLGGRSYRFYLVWLKLPNAGTGRVMEVTARA
jgi:serine/threonine protein kinase